jgi:hypothetical protein
MLETGSEWSHPADEEQTVNSLHVMNTRAHTNTNTYAHTQTHNVHGDPRHINDHSTDMYNPDILTEVNDWHLRLNLYWNTFVCLFVWDFAGR